MRKVFALILVFAIVLGLAAPASAASEPPEVTAEGAVVMDLTTGEIVYAKNGNERLYPASATKILTAIIVIENLNMGTEMTADEEVASIKGSRLGMRTGERINARDALNLMLVGSCNDLAVLFAKQISGSVEAFSKVMNEKAAEIGCTDTHFVNPNGLHDDDHYTTPADLAIIAQYCMQSQVFRDIVKKTEYTYTRGAGASKPGEEVTVKTTNWLLYNDTTAMYVGNDKRTPKYGAENGDLGVCLGIKTGSTPEALGVLVAAAQKDDTSILTVVMRSDGDTSGAYERFVDSIKLLNWGLANYKTVRVLRMGTELGSIKVKKGEVNTVPVALASDVYATLEVSQTIDGNITTETIIDESVTAPVNLGTVCGKLNVFKDGKQIGQYNIVTGYAIKKGGALSVFGITDATAKKIVSIVVTLIVIVVVLFAAYIVYLKIKSDRIKKRKAARAKAREEQRKRDLLEGNPYDRFTTSYKPEDKDKR